METSRGPFEVPNPAHAPQRENAPSNGDFPAIESVLPSATPEQTTIVELPDCSDLGPTRVARKFDCPNYDHCLSLCAALNWDSFSCGGCCGEINQQLVWRAHHSIKSDLELACVCKLPTLTSATKRRSPDSPLPLGRTSTKTAQG